MNTSHSDILDSGYDGASRVLGFASLLIAVAFVFSVVVLAPPAADARPAKCFGKKINRVVKGKKKTVRVAFKDVTWIAGNKITVIGKPYSHICADKGKQKVIAGKGKSMTSTGRGNDRIELHPSSHLNVVKAGLGNDVIKGSNGNDILYGGPKKAPKNAADRDTVNGLRGNDRIYDYAGDGNRLYGTTGVDKIYSLGTAVSSLFGGNGSDYLYSNGGKSKSGRIEQLFGERGNDHMNADRSPSFGPVFLDGGSGDDWANGTEFGDIVIFHSGITKTAANGGDDLIIATSRGQGRVDGGAGKDTMSFAIHTPEGASRNGTGVEIDLGANGAQGIHKYSLDGIENAIGSSFDDYIVGQDGQQNKLSGGLGDDTLIGNANDSDEADGGLGFDACEGFRQMTNCSETNPGYQGSNRVLVDINESGVLTVMGGQGGDQISIGYDRSTGQYRVDAGNNPVAAGLCSSLGSDGKVSCPAAYFNLNGILVYGDDGDDRIAIENSVPAYVTTTINGGTGKNVLLGGKTKDVLSTEPGSRGSRLEGGPNLDQIYLVDGSTVKGGADSDVIHAQDPCSGGKAWGGKGADNVVFNGAAKGVKADLGRGYAQWVHGKCANRLKLGNDIDNLEGTKHNDHLILGPKKKTQDRKRSLLGRYGIDTLDGRNGYPDTITTGQGGRRNKVISDKKDKVQWGWGQAGA
ncbi:MAG: calcium-binding protein [Solirubrobacterales bacterium]